MLKSESGATMDTALEETPSGWVARYLIVSEDLGQVKPQRAVFRSKADAVAWLTAEATVHGFVYETAGVVVRPEKLQEELSQHTDEEIEKRLAAAVWVDDKRAAVLRCLEDKKLDP